MALNLGGKKVGLFHQNNLETATVAKGRVDLCRSLNMTLPYPHRHPYPELWHLRLLSYRTKGLGKGIKDFEMGRLSLRFRVDRITGVLIKWTQEGPESGDKVKTMPEAEVELCGQSNRVTPPLDSSEGTSSVYTLILAL